MKYAHVHEVKVGDNVTTADGHADTFDVASIEPCCCGNQEERVHINGRDFCMHVNSLILVNH